MIVPESERIPDVDWNALLRTATGRALIRMVGSHSVQSPDDLHDAIWQTGNAIFRMRLVARRAKPDKIEIVLRGLEAAMANNDMATLDAMAKIALRSIQRYDPKDIRYSLVRDNMDKGEFGRYLVEHAKVFREMPDFAGVMALFACAGPFSNEDRRVIEQKLRAKFERLPPPARTEPEELAVAILRALGVDAKTARNWVMAREDMRIHRTHKRGG